MADALQSTVWRLVFFVGVTGVAMLVVGLALGVAVSGVNAPFEQPGERIQTGDGQTHQNPAELETGGDLAALEQHLSSGLIAQAEQRMDSLSAEEYDQARELLGDEQTELLLEEYRTVASEVGAEDRLDAFEQAQQAQINQTEHVTSYWELYDTYVLLANDGYPHSTALEIPTDVVPHEYSEPLAVARDLEQLAQAANESTQETVRHYQRLEAIDDNEGAYDSLITSANETLANVTETQQEVRDEQFVETELSLDVERTTISPSNPLELQGQLTEAGGTPLTNENITIDFGAQTHNATTDETGEFSLTYRPTVLPANETVLDVEYVPAPESVYMGDSQSLDVQLERESPQLDVSVTPTEAAINETVAVTGSVQAEDAGLPAVPYAVFVDGQLLAEGETNERGAINSTLTMPADVEAGEQPVTVYLPLQNATLKSANESTALAVEETASVLSITATPGEDETVLVTGTLETRDGVALDNQSVGLRIDESGVGTARTDADGEFEQFVAVPESAIDGSDEDATVTVSASFDGMGTNLEPVSEQTTLSVPVTTLALDIPPWTLALVALLAVLGLAVFGYLRIRRDGSEQHERDPTPVVPLREPDSEASEVSLELAGELLAAGNPAAAVQVGYATLRRRLVSNPDASRKQTHWEFYHEYRSQLDEETEQTLRTVTERYELAAFAPEAADATMATEVLDAIRSLDNAEYEPLGTRTAHEPLGDTSVHEPLDD